MRVKIGPYLTWWGPYQIADLVFGNPEKYPDTTTWRHRAAERLGDWLAKDRHGGDSWFARACQWIYDRRQRQVYVHIDNYDVWNMDETLRHIIGPMFVLLKSKKQGYGLIADEDVPEHLHSTHAPAECEWELDGNAEKRYEWVLDELIWAFCTDHEQARAKFWDHSAVDDRADLNTQVHQLRVDREGLDAYEARLGKAYQLFGKYYQTFWD